MDEHIEDEPLFAAVPEDLATLDDAQLAALIEDYEQTIDDVTGNPAEFVSAELSAAALIEQTQEAINTLRALKEAQASRTDETTVETVELSDEEKAAFEALAAEDTEPVVEVVTPEAEVEVVEPVVDKPAITAAVRARRNGARGAMPAPTREHEIVETAPAAASVVPLVAAAGAPDAVPGQRFNSEMELAESLVKRHDSFGATGPGTVEKYVVARAEWKDVYPDDRRWAGNDMEANFGIASRAVRPSELKRALRDRIHEVAKNMGTLTASGSEHEVSFVASGGLCAPVTPYYNLQYISVPIRPVMGSLPSFQADRGGLRYARPAALSAVSTAVGLITEAEDALGGTSATKTCQVIPCPPFIETDVDIIYHCLQFGNLGARAFPELVAQWNNLTLAAHARLAESNLLTQIDAFSTQVTAGDLGLGASANLFSQILAAANGLRSRNRMDPEAVLRLMLPWWAVDLIISDVIRTQFQRFDTDQAKVVALLRSFNIEPTFHIDGANGRFQVFPAQTGTIVAPQPLVAFPSEVVWYLFPEGSFLYLDSGTLELGIVRDSVLNKTNDFQLFGETFENVAFVGVESLAVASSICDSGVVAAPHAVINCGDYAFNS